MSTVVDGIEPHAVKQLPAEAHARLVTALNLASMTPIAPH